MTRQEYAKSKAKLASINQALREGHLTPEERSDLEASSVALTGQLLSPWFPVSLEGKAIMLFLSGLGFYGLIEGPIILLFAWPLSILLSPRVAGESLYPGGRAGRRPPLD